MRILSTILLIMAAACGYDESTPNFGDDGFKNALKIDESGNYFSNDHLAQRTLFKRALQTFQESPHHEVDKHLNVIIEKSEALVNLLQVESHKLEDQNFGFIMPWVADLRLSTSDLLLHLHYLTRLHQNVSFDDAFEIVIDQQMVMGHHFNLTLASTDLNKVLEAAKYYLKHYKG